MEGSADKSTVVFTPRESYALAGVFEGGVFGQMPIAALFVAYQAPFLLQLGEDRSHFPGAHGCAAFSQGAVHITRTQRGFTIGYQLGNDAVNFFRASLFDAQGRKPRVLWLLLKRCALYQKPSTPARARSAHSTADALRARL